MSKSKSKSSEIGKLAGVIRDRARREHIKWATRKVAAETDRETRQEIVEASYEQYAGWLVAESAS